jgi:hypothetical protein
LFNGGGWVNAQFPNLKKSVMVTDFIYNDIVLHSKGWLYKNGDMLDELGYLFSKIYGWKPTTEKQIAPMMLKVLDELDVKVGRHRSLYQWFSEIYNRMDLFDVSFDKAIILYVRSELQGLSKEQIKLNPPHYGKKEYFRMGSLFGENPISMTYTEMNRRAQKMFT